MSVNAAIAVASITTSPNAPVVSFELEMVSAVSGRTITLAQKWCFVATFTSVALITLSLLTTLARAHLPDVKTAETPKPSEKKRSLISDLFHTSSTAISLTLATACSLNALGFACDSSCLLPAKDIPDVLKQRIELLISPEKAASFFNTAARGFVKGIQNSSGWTASFAAVALAGTLYSVYSKTSDSPAKRWLDRFAIVSLGLATVISLCTAVYARIHSPKMV